MNLRKFFAVEYDSSFIKFAPPINVTIPKEDLIVLDRELYGHRNRVSKDSGCNADVVFYELPLKN